MTKRSTHLQPWPRRGTTVESMTAWREHVRQHILWIDEHRADLKIYKGIRKVYLQEFLRVSVLIQKQRVAQNKTTAKAA